MLEIVGIKPDQIMDVWPHVSGYFESFQDRSKGELTAGELLLHVIEKRLQCWIALDGKEVKACALTELSGTNTVVFAFCAGKDREEWRDKMVDEIEKWTAHLKRGRVRIICRPGWVRELKGLGYKESHRVLEKDI
jgi:hypothetical protein